MQRQRQSRQQRNVSRKVPFQAGWLPGAVSSLVKKIDVKPHWGWPPAHSPATATAAFGFYFFK